MRDDMPWFMIPVMYYLAPKKLDDDSLIEVEKNLKGVLGNYMKKDMERSVLEIFKASPIRSFSAAILTQLMGGVDDACQEVGWSREEAMVLLDKAGKIKISI